MKSKLDVLFFLFLSHFNAHLFRLLLATILYGCDVCDFFFCKYCQREFINFHAYYLRLSMTFQFAFIFFLFWFVLYFYNFFIFSHRSCYLRVWKKKRKQIESYIDQIMSLWISRWWRIFLRRIYCFDYFLHIRDDDNNFLWIDCGIFRFLKKKKLFIIYGHCHFFFFLLILFHFFVFWVESLSHI